MNVVDFQYNKLMSRQHTHDFILNTSKVNLTKGKGKSKKPGRGNVKDVTGKTGTNVQVNNFFFGNTQGVTPRGRTSLNGVSSFQPLPQGFNIPIHMTMPQGYPPPIQAPQGVAVPVPLGGIPLGGIPLGGAVPPPPNNPPNAVPDWMRPAMEDITNMYREQRDVLTDLRNQMNQNAPNQEAIRQQILDTEENFTRLMMNTNIESLEIQRDYFNNLNREIDDSGNRLREGISMETRAELARSNAQNQQAFADLDANVWDAANRNRLEVADDTRGVLASMRTDLNRSIQVQTGEVIDAGSRISQAMNQRLEELAGLANMNLDVANTNLTQGILALPLKRGGANNEKSNLQRETIINQLDNPNISDAQRKYLESALVALNEPSKKGNTEKRNDTDEEPNFNNSMGSAAGGSQRPTPAIEFSQRPSLSRTSMINIEPTASMIETPLRQPRSLLMGRSLFEPSDENENTDNNTMADLSMTEPTIDSESGSDKNERSKLNFRTDDSDFERSDVNSAFEDSD